VLTGIAQECPLHPRYNRDDCPKCKVLLPRVPLFDEDTGIPHFPILLRRETGLMEFQCIHGVGHPAAQSAHFLDVIHGDKKGTWSIHGCDGCCGREDFPELRYISPRLEIVRDGE